MKFEKVSYGFFIFCIEANIRMRRVFFNEVLQRVNMGNIWNTDIE